MYTSVPAVQSEFDVIIPGLNGINAFRCETGEAPIPEVITNTMQFCGQPMTLPTDKKKVSGAISLTLQEDWSFSTLRILRSLFPHFGKSNVGGNPELHDIRVKLSSRFPVTTAIEAAPDLINNPHVNISEIPDGSVWFRYKNAFLQNIQPLRLDWSKPEAPIKWQIVFTYNCVEIIDDREKLYEKVMGLLGKKQEDLQKKTHMKMAAEGSLLASAEYLTIAEINSRLGAVGRLFTDTLSTVGYGKGISNVI